VPALVALALAAAVWIAFHAYEIIGWRATLEPKRKQSATRDVL